MERFAILVKGKQMDLVEVNPRKLGGKPVIKGTRIPVELILQYVNDGATLEEILEDYPHLSRIVLQEILKLAKLTHEAVGYKRVVAATN